MEDFKNILKDVSLSGDAIIKQRMIRLFIILCAFISGAAICLMTPGVFWSEVDKTLAVYLAVLLIIYLFLNITSNSTLAALVLVYLTGGLLLPVLFLMTMGMYGGMPILFLVGFVMAFLLLDGIALVVAVILLSVWDVLVMAFVYYYPEKLLRLIDSSTILDSIIFCFAALALIILVVITFYTLVYRQLKNSIEASHRFIQLTGEVKSKFLANTSGELRTPMNAILTMTEMLERDEENEKVAGELALIKESAFSLLAMINNVLTYSALDAGDVRISRSQFYFGSILKDLIYTMSVELMDKNVRFLVKIDPDIPDVLYGDVSKIRQVFRYILNNAVRNTYEGRILLEVQHKRNIAANSYIITVRVADTGPGFTEDEKKAVFDSFEIYDSRKYSQLKKIGLEMNICREMLALMNGNISIDSINGVGTCTTFYFEIFSADSVKLVDRSNLNSLKVLVYAAKGENSQLWMNLMGQMSVVPDLADSAGAFISRLREKSYDRIFLDDGLYPGVVEYIRSYECEDRTYVVTDYRHKYGDFGDCRILRRPVSCLNLNEALADKWLSSDYLGTITETSFVAPKAKILVVDNNMLDLHMVAGILDRFGINASIATSGGEALDKCSRQIYDLILLNQSMPGRDGKETLRQIRSLPDERYADIPIICLTSTLKYENREGISGTGFQDILVKPVRRAPLEAILKNYLDKELIEERTPGDTRDSRTPADSANMESNLDKFPPGLSVDTGLMHSGGDEDIYCTILNTYYSEGEAKIDDIRREHMAGDLEMFTINVHAVKGSSAGVGGLEVSELFRRLEMAGKEGNTSYINNCLDEALDKYRGLLENVRDYLMERGHFDSEDDAATGEIQDFDIGRMKEIRQYLEDFDTQSLEELIDELRHLNYGEEINSYLRKLASLCDSFEYDSAMELVDEFLEIFGGRES